jgi:uncharacterized protein YjeT (DUF2065 family)
MELGIERLTALAFIVTSLSHITAPRAWVRFFLDMRSRGPEVAGLLNAYVHGPLGFLIVAFHPVWSGPGLLVTLLGCALSLKGSLYFIWPTLSERSFARISAERAWQFRAAGVPMLALGLTIGWLSMR